MNSIVKRALQLAAGGAGAAIIATALVKPHEGVRYTPYRDVVGVLTVCHGHTGADINPKKTYTAAECDALLKKDIAIAQKAVKRNVKVPMSPWMEASLIDFTFNLGEGNLRSSTMLKKFNAGNYAEGCAELRRWVYASGKQYPGLVNRRANDREVCEWQPEKGVPK